MSNVYARLRIYQDKIVITFDTDTVQITWNAATNATSYELWRSLTSSSSAATQIAASVTTTSYSDSSATQGQLYYYWVKAKNSSGASGFSVYNTGYAAIPVPLAPTNVQASDGSYTDRVQVSWNTSLNATSYEVWRNSSSSSTSAVLIAPNISGTAYADTTGTPEQTYYYWVKAKNTSGVSGFSGANTGYRRQPGSVITNCTTVSEISKLECEALVALYTGAGGANWSTRTGWGETNTPCSWYGVTCSSGHVTEVDLDTNQLSGALPAQLGNLTMLRRLDLKNNQLNGSIPPQLGTLSHLDRLDLANNRLSGQIPSQLGSLTQLNALFLSNNRLSGGIPAQLGNLANLSFLHLSGNQLSGAIPPALSQLTQLQVEGYYGGIVGYNALTGSDPTLIAFLNGKEPGWASTQTVPPRISDASATSPTTVRIDWTPIAYTGDGGYYRVKMATTPGGPYTEAGTTTDKLASSLTITGLTPNLTYYFTVETVTLANSHNQNMVTSLGSSEVSVTLASGPTSSEEKVYLPLVIK